MQSNREIFWFWKSIALNHVNEVSKKVSDAFQELRLRDDANNSLLDALEHFVVVILPKQGAPYSNKSVLT